MQRGLFFQMERLQVWGLFSLFTLTIAQNSSSFLLLAPSTFRPGLPVSLTVTILTDSHVLVSADVGHGNQTLTSNSMQIEGGSTELLILPPIQDMESMDKRLYQLRVKGHVEGVQLFSTSTYLRLDPKSFSTLIQTDKMWYLPGQEVKFRAVSIQPDGKPLVGQADIVIRDPRGSMLRQWLDVDSVLGVVAETFKLSENPPLGDWTITTTIKEISTVKHFTVARYVLPKFEVLINVPEVIYREDILQGSVTAKYTFGKSVQGRMNISYIPNYQSMNEAYSEEREIDGTEDFTFDFSDDSMKESVARLILYGRMESLTVVVQVTEHLTGLTYNNTAKVSLARNRYKVSFHCYPKTLRPLNFTAMLKISTFDGRALSAEDQQKMVEVSVMQDRRSSVGRMDMMEPNGMNASSSFETYADSEETPAKEMEFPVPADGVIPLNIEVMQETDVLTIYATLEDGHDTLQLFRSYTSPSNSYLQIQRPSTPLEVGSPFHLVIESNFPKDDIHYMVKSRGQVVLAGRDSGGLTLVPDPSWAPMACIIVYCVHPSGEVINDAVKLPIKQYLENQVSLKWSSEMKRPAENVNLTVTVAEPSSLVGILVVDKATQWAGSNNDLTEERVMKALEGFSGAATSKYSDMVEMGDPNSVFQKCDLVVLTDAHLHPPSYLSEFPGEIMFNLAHAEEQPTAQQGEEPHERRNFPETWIWLLTDTGNSETLDLPFEVPDSITSWVATAFVMSDRLGLGIVEEPAVLTVFQDFFLSLNLPACVIRGEELVLEIILFNYLPQALEITVVIAWSETFEFVYPDIEGVVMPSVRQVFVESQSGASLLVPIRPLVLGEMPISVKATSSVASDRVLRMVLVKAEGLEQSFSNSLLLELSSSDSNLSRNISFSFPPDVVEGSKRALVKVAGDILGPSISGLDSLIKMPYGCGEQNMINFAPNVYVLQYLSATNQDNVDITARAEGFMLAGYERELSFQRQDGSFSAFGENDSSGSTWLSAFVLRCFLQARPFITIDARVLHDVAAWIGAQQGADGRFEEAGRVIHTELQGGLDGEVSLTAYVVIALLEDSDIKVQFSSQISSALVYLETRLALGVSSNYSLGLLAYALALAGSPSTETALSKLLERASITDGVPMWSSPNAGFYSSWQPRSADIELASYVLLTQHKLGQVTEGLDLMKWLSRQRNDRGGFGSTQDTIVALQALSTFATLTGSEEMDLTIRVMAEGSLEVASFHILQENQLLHQSQQIEPTDELNLQVAAEGRGLALIQLNVFYNVRNDGLMRRRRNAGEQEAFDLYVDLIQDQAEMFQLHVCCSLAEGLGLNMTGMVIMEVGLLSGFSLSQDGVPTNGAVKKVEAEPGKVVLYLDSVSTTEKVCVTIPQVMEHKVAKVQEAAVLVYDYYEPRRRAVKSFKSQLLSDRHTCSFCGDGCSLCQGKDQPEVGAASQNRLNVLLLYNLLLLFVIRSV